MRDACSTALSRLGHDVELATSGSEGLGLLGRWVYDLILLDLRMPGMDGFTTLERIIETDPEALVIILTGHGSVGTAVKAMKIGAADFLAKPFTPLELRRAVGGALEKRQLLLENALLRSQVNHSQPPTRVITRSKTMAKVLEVLDRVAATDVTVLLTGESGTGKGLLARRIHQQSPRAGNPFVPVDCSTLVSTLIESELFGHVRGAFTGAESDKAGKFEIAQGGTLFLDELANISLDVQAKLLTAVEERTVCRVGRNRAHRIDARLVAATNQDLARAVKSGAFRQDLYYRLNVVHIELPALRDRDRDVSLLAEHFLDRYRRLNKLPAMRFTPRALDALGHLPWPGNVRELANTVHRLAILVPGPRIDRDDIESFLPGQIELDEDAILPLAEVQRRHILTTLRRLGGHRTRTAQALGIDRKTLRNKLDQYRR